MAVDLTVIIVNTNEKHVLYPCLISIFRETKEIVFEVIVVDNASTDGSLEMIAREFPEVRLLRNVKNLGFAASNNVGIQQASGNFILLLNPDTEVLNSSLQKTLKFFEKKIDVGIVGCKLLYSDGRIQPSVRSYPNFWNLFFESTFLYLAFPKSVIFGRYYMTYFDYISSREVDWLSGAFFMIRRGLVDKIGLLDERFYMYSEEEDFCFRAKRAGFKTMFFADAETLHHWGGPNTQNLRLIVWLHKSQILFFHKHFFGHEKLLLICLKFLGIFLRIFVYLTVGVCSFNKKYLRKAYYYAVTLIELLRIPAQKKMHKCICSKTEIY